ncbi:MAG: hypothetical protein ACFFER_06130 [Candidatus Thorarchaeota archaeon]
MKRRYVSIISFLVIGIFFLACVPASANIYLNTGLYNQPGQSALENASFEDWTGDSPDDWYEYPSTAWSKSYTHLDQSKSAYGYYSYSSAIYLRQSLPLSAREDLADKSMEFSFWFKASSSTAAKAKIAWSDDQGSDSDQTPYIAPSTDSGKPWKQIRLTVDFDGQPSYVNVYIYARGYPSTQIWVDAAKVCIIDEKSTSSSYGDASLVCRVFQVQEYSSTRNEAFVDIALGGTSKEETDYRIYSSKLRVEMLPLHTYPHSPTYTSQYGDVAIDDLFQSNDRERSIHGQATGMPTHVGAVAAAAISLISGVTIAYAISPMGLPTPSGAILGFITSTSAKLMFEAVTGTHSHAYGYQQNWGRDYYTEFLWDYSWPRPQNDISVSTADVGHRAIWKFEPEYGNGIRIIGTITWGRLTATWLWPFGPWVYSISSVATTTLSITIYWYTT